MFDRIFDMDNIFFRFMGRVADIIILNMLFLLTSIPIVTIGSSYTALYYFSLKAVANEEGYLWKSYWKSFKLNFKQGFIMEVIFALIAWILYVDIRYLYQMGIVGNSFGWKLLFFAVIGITVLVIIMFIYAFPLLSRFDNKTSAILKNALFMGLRHLTQTVPLLLLAAVAVFAAWALFPLSIFFIVPTWVYLSSILLNKVIDRYIPKSESERYDEDYYLGAEAEAEPTHIIINEENMGVCREESAPATTVEEESVAEEALEEAKDVE